MEKTGRKFKCVSKDKEGKMSNDWMNYFTIGKVYYETNNDNTKSGVIQLFDNDRTRLWVNKANFEEVKS